MPVSAQSPSLSEASGLLRRARRAPSPTPRYRLATDEWVRRNRVSISLRPARPRSRLRGRLGRPAAGPCQRRVVRHRRERRRLGPPVAVVRRGRHYFGLHPHRAAVVADAGQHRRRPRPYYLLMHGWFAVFPATEFWSRLSSAVAVGLAAAGVVVLGRQLSTRPVASRPAWFSPCCPASPGPASKSGPMP